MSTIPEGYEAITVGMNLTGRTIRFLKTVEWQGYEPYDNGFLDYDGINGYFLKTNAGDIALLFNGADVNVQYYSTLPGVEFGDAEMNYSGSGFATTMSDSPININTDYTITGENAVVTYIHEVNEALGWDINDYIVVKSVVQKYITLDNLQEFLAKCDERYQMKPKGYNVSIRDPGWSSMPNSSMVPYASYSIDNGDTWNTLDWVKVPDTQSAYKYVDVILTGVTQIKFRSYNYRTSETWDVWESDILSLRLENYGSTGTYVESDNFILTQDVPDIIIFVTDYS